MENLKLAKLAKSLEAENKNMVAEAIEKSDNVTRTPMTAFHSLLDLLVWKNHAESYWTMDMKYDAFDEIRNYRREAYEGTVDQNLSFEEQLRVAFENEVARVREGIEAWFRATLPMLSESTLEELMVLLTTYTLHQKYSDYPYYKFANRKLAYEVIQKARDEIGLEGDLP